MLLGTEVPMGGDTIPVKATATGRIKKWYYRPGEKFAGGTRLMIDKGWTICDIEVRDNGFLRWESVEAPVDCVLVKIIKEEGELVSEGETVGEVEPIATHEVPPGILDRYDPFSIG